MEGPSGSQVLQQQLQMPIQAQQQQLVTSAENEPSSSTGSGSSSSSSSGSAGTLAAAAAAVAAVAASVEASMSSGVVTSAIGEPCKKKPRVDNSGASSKEGLAGSRDQSGPGGGRDVKFPEKLEHRLGGILCCAVCLDLPRAAIYQVS